MNTFEIKAKNPESLKDYEELVRACQSILEKISDYAPSDNNVYLSIEKRGMDFIAKLKLTSQSLAFDCLEITKSPFMAIERVSRNAMEKIRTWSITR